MESEIRAAVEARFSTELRQPPKLKFITWGRHLASNAFGDIKHVIVVGLLQYGHAQAEAMARGAGGLPLGTDFPKAATDTFHKGEIAHHLFQAVGRGAVRKAINGDVPNGCKLDVIFSTRGNGGSVPVGIDILRKAFPGAKIERWEPIFATPKGNELKLIVELDRLASLTLEGSWVKQKELASTVGITNSNIWATMERPHVLEELNRRGVWVQRRKGDRRGWHVSRLAPGITAKLGPHELEAASAREQTRRQRRSDRRQRKQSRVPPPSAQASHVSRRHGSGFA